jgi:hypothetical protein
MKNELQSIKKMLKSGKINLVSWKYFKNTLNVTDEDLKSFYKNSLIKKELT